MDRRNDRLNQLAAPKGWKERLEAIGEKLPVPTYACPMCSDSAWELRENRKGIVYGKPCTYCEAGQAIAAGWKRKDARDSAKADRKSRIQRIRDAAGDDIPF